MSSRPDENPARSSPGLSDLQKPLEHFRAKSRRTKIHPAERAALWIICAHLVFLPWALGGMRLWAQIISLGFSVAGMAVALFPRTYTGEHSGAGSFRLLTWPKLLKFPIFWIGLVLLGYVTLQALNPSWTYATDGKGWWMDARPHRAWLPTGVDVPFARGGPWRALMIYASAWLTVCSIWIAFTRRRTVQAFLLTLAGNGLLLAIFGVAQRLVGNGKMFWFFESPNSSYFASFIYKNHAGAYLNLSLAVTCGLAAWYYLRGLRRLEKSNPSGVLAFFSTCIAVAVLTSYARGATLVMLVFLLGCIGAFVVHQLVIPSENRRPVVAVVLILVFGYFLKTGFDALRSHEAWDRLKQGITRVDDSLGVRERATAASLEMLGETRARGVGAGSYQFLFPIYQHRHPDLVFSNGRGMFWEHAHNDILEIPIELGVFGTALILVAAGYWLLGLTRNYFWENPLSGCLVFGLLLAVVYAWWDFPFQCPAVLFTWCALWPAVALWTQYGELNARS